MEKNVETIGKRALQSTIYIQFLIYGISKYNFSMKNTTRKLGLHKKNLIILKLINPTLHLKFKNKS